jgi:hypothetical protein
MPKSPAPAVPLAGIVKTRFLPTRGGRLQCWGARTTDGVWDFEREDLPGTPWAVTHRPTETVVDRYVGTLDDCRAYVASGQAQADLDLIRAHELGGHENERSRSCPKC